VVTYRDVKASPSGWEDLTMSAFELALSELIDQWRNKSDKQHIINAQIAQTELVTADAGWTRDGKDIVEEDSAA
jgi:hypothetical protein